MARIVFVCKDPALQQYYEEEFGEEFTKAATEAEAAGVPESVTPDGQTIGWRMVLEQLFTARMLKEAQLQEHYNYEEVDGQRRIIYVEHEDALVPQLLIPKIEIT